MSKSRFRWIMPVLRYGLCVVALAYLVWKVPWHDRVRIDGPHGPWVRLLERRTDKLVIQGERGPETINYDRVHHVLIEGRTEPAIELGIASVVLQTDKQQALLAIVLFAPVVVLQLIRLVIMLAVQGVRLSLWSSTKLTFVGNFFNFALPGSTGGDWIKAYYLTHYTHLKTEAFTTVFLDRAIGLLGIVIIAGVTMLLSWDPARFRGLMLTIVIVLAVLAAGSVVVFSRRLRAALRLSEFVARLPAGQQLLRVGRATLAMRQRKLLVTMSLLITLVLQAIAIVSAAVFGWALNMHGPAGHAGVSDLLYFFVYVAVGFLIAAIPIAPPQGFGVMEAAYVQFFKQGGLNTASQAVALALAVRLIQLVWALPGVLVPLLGAHLPTKAEREALEAATATSGE